MEIAALNKKLDLTPMGEVAETLLITLSMKSKESRKKRPILKDRIAEEVSSRINYDFTAFNTPKRSALSVVVKARHFDRQVMEFILNNINPVIVVLGCGLDARAQRIGKLGDKTQFYQLDLPEVIALRKQLIPLAFNEELIAESALATAWMDDIKEKHPNGAFLFIAEGLFMYFEKEEVETIFVHLANNFPGGEIHFDILNEWMAKNAHRRDSIKALSAEFKSGFDDDQEMETWHKRLTYESTKLFCSEKEFKRLGLSNRIMSLLPRYRKAGRMIHYKIKD